MQYVLYNEDVLEEFQKVFAYRSQVNLQQHKCYSCSTDDSILVVRKPRERVFHFNVELDDIGDDNDESFHLTRETLKAKQKLLKQIGKGNKPKRAQPLTDEEISVLFDKNVLEYELSTICGFISSVERKPKRHKFGHSVIEDDNDESFHLTRETLKAKQKLLKQKGKGNKPKRAQPLTDEEISVLFDKNILGDNSPKALNTVLLNNCVQFGLTGVSGH
ncbi:unnamed protein product [Mytilus edulis]|uniref:Uncharacterized protein n=1 Tax=Mytilus edulis TaxID=6550 RepID=A0A8S3UQL9_MYTED|nr:unnamed protein product [Mytilus edulis]